MAQAAAIRDRAVSSEELVGAHLRRIEAVNPAINAVVQMNPDAIAEAQRADRELASGAPIGPFHGVPFTVKDWLEVAGIACAGGFEERRNYVPRRDATVVARMRAAGGIVLGKTNVQETNPVYGDTRNPRDATRSPGASSSGEAAAVAAGCSPLGLGSDSGGSLRYPAHCCGVTALKPTTGRVPVTGHFPRIGASHDPRTVVGPLSRHVEDLWLALAVIAGVDWRDPSVVPVPLAPPPATVAGWRVGWFTEMPGATPDAATVAAIGDCVRRLAEAGADVEEVTLPRLADSWPLTQTYWQRVQSLSLNEWLPDKPSRLSEDEIERSIFEWDRYRRAMLEFIAVYDAIICPVASAPAPEHGSMTPASYLYTLPFSLVGWPVVSTRVGTAGDGMPIGAQVVARPWAEPAAITTAMVLQTALGG